MSKKSSIVIDVTLDETKTPAHIEWNATDSHLERAQEAKAFLLSIWDGADKSALRIDLWTNKMMVDEMADFFYQTLMTMAETYGRATNYQDQVADMKKFAVEFYQKFQDKQMKSHKA